MSLLLGIDIGGTNIKSVIVDNSGGSLAISSRDIEATNTAEGVSGVLEQVLQICDRVAETYPEVERIGIGVPGLYDEQTGELVMLPNVPGDWQGVPLRGIVTRASGRNVCIINDARAFTLAEHRIGAGRGSTNMLGVTLGTGVGGGLIIGGKLYLGYNGRAGEIGHQTIVPDGPLCGCGNHGCLEALVRARTITAMSGYKTVEETVNAARHGDSRAHEAIMHAARYLGIGLANIVTIFTPDAIVIGGGIAHSGDFLFKPMQQEIKKRVKTTDPAKVTIKAAELGIWAGAIGAALFSMERQ